MSGIRSLTLAASFAASFAASACAGVFGVGELSAGREDDGAAGASGADRPPATGGGETVDSGAGGSRFIIGSGGSTITFDTAGRSAIGTAGAIGSGHDGQVPPPSCADLPATCGTAQSASRDCCASLEVTGGSFFRSYDRLPDAGWDEPSSPATVSTFRLDVYEVTVGRFRRFVAALPWLPGPAAGSNPANAADFGWNEAWAALMPVDADSLKLAFEGCESSDGSAALPTWTEVLGANEALPINCLTWFEAFAFCAWDGGRLPTEAEWNYAAAGGAEARVYPWASTLGTDIGSSYAIYDSAIAPVGSKSLGNGRFGQADLAGNVAEWNVDWYWEAYTVPCDDCAELTRASVAGRVLRGGFYSSQPPALRAAAREKAPPNTRDSGYGVRCARPPSALSGSAK